MDDNLENFISQNKLFLELKISEILRNNSNNGMENNIKYFFKKRNNFRIKVAYGTLLFLSLMKKNELTGPDFEKLFNSSISKSTFKKISRNIENDDIIIKSALITKTNTNCFSLNTEFRNYLNDLLYNHLNDNSKDEIKFLINSYRPFMEITEGKKNLSFYDDLNSNNSLIEKWIKVYDKIKNIRYEYSRQGPNQPKFFFDIIALHESIAFLLGYHLYKFSPSINQLNKATGQFEYWTIIHSFADSDYHDDWKIEKLNMKKSDEIVFIINISGAIKGGVKRLLDKINLDLPIYNITIKSGVKDNVIRDNLDANKKLYSLIQFIETLRNESFIKQVHLFYKGPIAFYCMLGDSIRNKFFISLYQRKHKLDDFYLAIELGNDKKLL